MSRRFRRLLVVTTLYWLGTSVFAQQVWAQSFLASASVEQDAERESRVFAGEKDSSFLIAAPQNLNPGLSNSAESILVEPFSIEQLPGRTMPTDVEENSLPTESADTVLPGSDAVEAAVPFIDWQGLTIEFSDSASNFGQDNQLVTPALVGQLANGDTLAVSLGFNQFVLPDLEKIYHLPLTITWEGDVSDVSFTVGGGLDVYNRLPLDTHFNAKVEMPAWKGASVSFLVEQGPYLFNAQTLENGISAWRYGPELYWQIDQKTSLFSLMRIGHFNDGNFEQQSFSRLERKLWGEGAIAANLFHWHFQQDLEATSGYFSPADFLVSSLELSWEKEVIEGVSCRLAGHLGQQRLNGEWALGYGHQLLCGFDIVPGIDFDLGYHYSTVGNGQTLLSEDSAYNSFQLLGGVNTTF